MGAYRQLKNIQLDVLFDINAPLFSFRTKNRYHPVVGGGNCNAKILFVGEAPGIQEAKTGKPFVGRSGRVLDSLLDHIALDRKKVFITNVIHDKPPKNRDPLPEEVKYYEQYLLRIIKAVQPEIICSLGRHSFEFFNRKLQLNLTSSISEVAGTVFEVNLKWGKISYMPTYHPAVTLYDPSQRKILEEHFKRLGVVISFSRN